MTLSIKSLFATLNINDSINDNINDSINDTLHKRHSVQMTLNITALNHHADCRYAECCILFIVMLNTASGSECRYAECHYAEYSQTTYKYFGTIIYNHKIFVSSLRLPTQMSLMLSYKSAQV
jgi:hypothetical protein